MKKIKDRVIGFCRKWYMKYMVVIAIGVAFIGFLDENSVMRHLQNRRQISELQDEIKQYRDRYESDKASIEALENDPKAQEKIARERYFMKAEDEDVYVLSDDPRISDIQPAPVDFGEQAPTPSEDETAQ